jgi:hypothetical protein
VIVNVGNFDGDVENVLLRMRERNRVANFRIGPRWNERAREDQSGDEE